MVFLILFGFLLVSPSTWAKENAEKIISRGESSGTFESFTWGDYAHVKIMENGKKLSFFAEKGAWSVFEDHAAKLKGTPIKISWEKVRKFIPEAGGEEEITRTTDVCSFKKIDLVSTIRKEKIKVCEVQ